MNRKRYNKDNFFKHTYCIFDERDISEIENIKNNYVSHSGSKYFFLPQGVYRISNHWGRVAGCRWRLNSLDNKSQQLKLGFAAWEQFFPNNEDQKIFFIWYDALTQTYTFKHVLEALPGTNPVLRDAKNTAKTLNEIKEINASNQWAKYLKYSDYPTLKHEVIQQLIHTNLNLVAIKRKYL